MDHNYFANKTNFLLSLGELLYVFIKYIKSDFSFLLFSIVCMSYLSKNENIF